MTGTPPLPALADHPAAVAWLDALASSPEEEIWLADQRSAQARRALRKYAAGVGLAPGYSAHPMRATFITTALENGGALEEVQKAAGHRHLSTTKLCHRRWCDPTKADSFSPPTKRCP
jgi:integrase